MENRDTRNALLGELPKRIRRKLDSHPSTLQTIVRNLVKTCANYEEGEKELFRVLNEYEMDSLTFRAAQKEWQTIKQEMAEQDQLITWIRGSRVDFSELKHMFTTATLTDYVDHLLSIEFLVRYLWDVQAGHRFLLRFIRSLQEHTLLPENIRRDLFNWCVQAPYNNVLRLSNESEEQFEPRNETHIIIKIEPGIQDPSMYLVSFWSNDNQGNMKSEGEGSLRVAANQLEGVISKQIEELTIGAPQDAVTLEFYLSKVLLSLPVDTWRKVSGIQKKRFIERFKVTKGLLERQEARNILVELRASTRAEQARLFEMLRKHPFMYDLTDCFTDWETRWRRLHNSGKLQYTDVAQPISQEGLLSLKKDTCFTPLTFTPSDLELKDENDPLLQLIIAGVPLIAWIRSGDNSAEFAMHSENQLFTSHCTCAISTAGDIVGLMHEICRHASDATDPYQISHNLNLIVDNPESKLPHFDRV